MFKFEDLFGPKKKNAPVDQNFSVTIDADKNLIIEPYLPIVMRAACNDNTGVNKDA